MSTAATPHRHPPPPPLHKIRTHLACLIDDERHRQQLALPDLAHHAHLDEKTVHRIITGRATRLSSILALLDALDLDFTTAMQHTLEKD